MANNLSRDKQVSIAHALVEGVSIRSTERMTGVHRDTIMRLGVRLGRGCAKIHNELVRGLNCTNVEVDEIWGYVAKKQAHLTEKDDPSRKGDTWVWVAIDADSKVVPSFVVGKRDSEHARRFIADLASRCNNRLQLSSDGLSTYIDAVEEVFGIDVDYAQVVKSYEAEPVGPGRYSPPRVSSVEKTVIMGAPDLGRATTSHAERQNLTMRMQIRRLTRLTNAFSKKLENHEAAMALHFANYNLCRVHRSLRVTPAMEAGVQSRVWKVAELVDAALEAEPAAR